MSSNIPTQKVNWVFTYGAAAGYMTFQILIDDGALDVDEVHSTSDGALMYTYIHLKKRISKYAVMQCMKRLNEKHGIILSEVFGYDCVGSHARSGNLMEHIAFRMVYEHWKENNPTFVSCTDGLPGVERGLLMQFDGFSKIKTVLSKRGKNLVPFLDEVENDLHQTKRKLDQETTRADLLEEERAVMATRIERLKEGLSKRNTEYLEVLRQKRDMEVRLAIHESMLEADEMIKTILGNSGQPSN
jgi:hypothetical protein